LLRAISSLFFLAAAGIQAQDGAGVLVVVNRDDPLSRRIGAYYVHKRAVPLSNVCELDLSRNEEIKWSEYERLEEGVATCLGHSGMREKILYIVTTRGVPLKVAGEGSGPGTESCAVDSELCLLYSKMLGVHFPVAGPVGNPFFGKRDEVFRRPNFPIYLVTRLAGYDFAEVKRMIDRSLLARNRGRFVFDMKSSGNDTGDNWLRAAAGLLPKNRVLLDESTEVIYNQTDVIGYAGWGSNDPGRKRRLLGFRWLPGALATEFVSTDGRTFERPPDDWKLTTWKDPAHFFAGSPQSLTADYIREGATGCSGHVYEPYLTATPRPDYLFPAYFQGRNLAESYYLAIPALSWQNIVIGDPLCRIGKAE